MKKFLSALTALILAIGLFTPAVAQKITVDPNLPKLPSNEAEPDQPGTGISQKVTYTSTDKRLAAVLLEISKNTGIDIQAGKDAANWQVRDLPVIVCARDISLTTLLRSIADSTHLAFTSATVGGIKRYYIWRTPKREQQLSDYFKAKEETASAKANLDWDSWLKLNNTHDSDLPSKNKDSVGARELATARSFAKVMAALPAGTKEKVFSETPVTFRLKKTSGALSDALKDFLRNVWERGQEGLEIKETASGENDSEPVAASPQPRQELTDNMMNSIDLGIRIIKGNSYELSFMLSSPMSNYPGYESPQPDYAADLLDAYEDLPEDPEPPQTDYFPGLHPLDLENCNGLGLDKKIKLQKPKDVSQQSFANYISDLSAASGFSIICEDFCSHKPWCNMDETNCYGQNTTLKTALPTIKDLVPIKWYINASRKLLVGSSCAWWDDHTSLAPESLVNGMVKDINGDGVDIDGAAKTILLTSKQREEWIFEHKYLFRYDISERYEPFWKLYAGLSAEGKALAKSDAGLPLSKLDRAAVLAAFTHCSEIAEQEGIPGQSDAMTSLSILFPGLEQRTEAWAKVNYPQLVDSESSEMPSVDVDEVFAKFLKIFPEIKTALDVPTDAAKIFTLNLRMQKINQAPAGLPVVESDEVALPEALKPSQYVMTIEGDGVKMLAGSLGLQFPLISEKRQAELIKEVQEKLKKSTTPEPK